MEAAMLMIDGAIVLLAVIMSLLDERRRPGTPARSLFRSSDAHAPAVVPVTTREGSNWRGRRAATDVPAPAARRRRSR